MSDTLYTLADLQKINDNNLAEINVSDLLDDAPLLARMAAVEASTGGTQHKYLKETAAPTVGFRSVNDGRDNDASEDTLVTVNLAILDASFAVDKAVADGYRRGREEFIAKEARRHLKSAFFAAEQQLLQNSDAVDGFTGFPGLTGLDAVADAMVLSAGGTTDSTATSVYLIRTGEADAALVPDPNGIQISETVTQRLTGSATGTYPAYYTPITGWLGLQPGSAYSVGRICNITEDEGASLDDELIYNALSLFPASRQPNLIVMNRRSLKQLRNSRTATNATGAPAPRPVDVDGIPIVVTDGLSSTETLLASGS